MTGLSIFLDLAALLVVAAFAIRGARRGFVMTVAGLAVVFLAYIGAGLAAKILSPAVASLIEPMLSGIELPDLISEETLAGINIAGVNIGGLGLFADAADAINAGADKIAKDIAAGVASTIAYAIVAVLAFVVLAVVLRVIFRAVNIVAKLPVLNLLNRTLGLVVGCLTGIVLMIAAAWITGLFDAYVTAETVEATLAYKYFADPPAFFKLFR